MTTDGGLDRAELAAAGRGVVQAETAFRKTWATLAGVYSFAATAESTNRTAAEIIDAVGRDREAATGEANALLHMTGLLAGETDAPASNWRAHSADVDRLVRLRAEAAAHVEMLPLRRRELQSLNGSLGHLPSITPRSRDFSATVPRLS